MAFFGTCRRRGPFSVCIKDGKNIDPTCGSGGFLIKAFEYIREKIEKDVKTAKDELRKKIEGEDYESKSEEEQVDINQQIEAMQMAMNKELDTLAEGSRLYNLSHNCIFGTDANPRMARTSKMNMIMHGDGHGGVHHHDGLLNVNGIYEERFDVILTNPPFGSRVEKSQRVTDQEVVDAKEIGLRRYITDKGEKSKILDLFDVGKMSGLTEVLFMERCLRLLKKGGRMGMVLPEGVLNTSNLQKVREYFEGRAKIILICSIPQDVFIAAGATVKPSLVFFKRFTEEEEKQYNEIKTRAYKEALQPYITEHDALLKENENLSENGKNRTAHAKIIRQRLAEIAKIAADEAKPLIKEYFDYEIPIAVVEDAGITSTGAASQGNELPKLQEEYKDYRTTANLWDVHNCKVSYIVKSDGQVYRISDGKEVALAW